MQSAMTITGYHSSDVIISKFSYEFTGLKEANDEYGSGFYFFMDDKWSHAYGKYSHECLLTMKKQPNSNRADYDKIRMLADAVSDEVKEDVGSDWAEDWESGFDAAVHACFDNATDEYDGYLNVWIDIYRNNMSDWAKNMHEILGFDGVIIKDRNIVVMFNKDAIEVVNVTEAISECRMIPPLVLRLK